jgi:hypothetical protein
MIDESSRRSTLQGRYRLGRGINLRGNGHRLQALQTLVLTPFYAPLDLTLLHCDDAAHMIPR